MGTATQPGSSANPAASPGPARAAAIEPAPQLDADQLAFVQFQQGCALLQAPVGTGKTLVLAERAAEALRRGTEPSGMLCVTFTNRAADELRHRIAASCGGAAKQIVVRTFHSLCAWFLRCEAKNIGLPVDFVIIDDDDSVDILTACGAKLGYSLAQRGYEKPAYDLLNAIANAKLNAAAAQGEAQEAGVVPEIVFNSFDGPARKIACAYQKELSAQHALDFADLVYLTRAALDAGGGVYKRWSRRFSFIQVDEMQDTHVSEYQVLARLAALSRNLALAGDFDQTIYEWRGSAPESIIKKFKRDFAPVRDFALATNYRSTRTLVNIAKNVVSRYNSAARFSACAGAPEGDPAVMHFARDAEAEAEWIAGRLSAMIESARRARAPLCLGRIGVLARTNNRAAVLSQALASAGVPHFTVEQLEFFRRQEVKDATARLNYLLNPADGRSLRRMLLRPAAQVSRDAVARIERAEGIGLRLADMGNLSALEHGEPFALLLSELARGSVVVFDTETTGLNAADDEIVEIAAVRLVNGQPTARFHEYIRNTKSVAESEAVHGLSDRFLAERGAAPADALGRFLAFSGGALLAGHNVSFDMRMLRANCTRCGLAFGARESADTLEMARRFINTDDRSLDALVKLLGIEFAPTHRAADDVNATVALLARLAPLARQASAARAEVVKAVSSAFMPIANEVAELRQLAECARPPQLLGAALERSGLSSYYADKTDCLNNLAELAAWFSDRDDASLDPVISLTAILASAAMSRNVDRLDPEGELVRVLSVHQSKGLEFDTVFVAGLSENEFPSFPSIISGGEHEELRVFYVAVTRARECLVLTGHARNAGKPRSPSPYMRYIGDKWVEVDSQVLNRR